MVCMWCGRGWGDQVHRHHRKRRRDAAADEGGTDALSNLVMLHPACHRDIHANPEMAKERGFIVSPWQNPTEVAVLAGDSRWYLLDDEGNREAKQEAL
jgi:5-methylcytosine-specific restriction endonuclease McrA